MFLRPKKFRGRRLFRFPLNPCQPGFESNVFSFATLAASGRREWQRSNTRAGGDAEKSATSVVLRSRVVHRYFAMQTLFASEEAPPSPSLGRSRQRFAFISPCKCSSLREETQRVFPASRPTPLCIIREREQTTRALGGQLPVHADKDFAPQLLVQFGLPGRVNWKVDPKPSRLSTLTLPPCASTKVLTMARPRPNPTPV